MMEPMDMLSIATLLQSQLTDVFRIGMVVALIATALRTKAVMGMTVPLLAGVVFVAVTMQVGSSVPLLVSVGVGIIANLILLGICLGVWEAFCRLTNR
jgi:hypothetical protein